MDKAEHGRRLAAAMAAKRYDRSVVADAVGKKPRSITNWTSGSTMPDAQDRHILRRLLGDYDAEGDRVEVAILSSDLTEDRRYMLLGTYKRMMREQSEGGPGAIA